MYALGMNLTRHGTIQLKVLGADHALGGGGGCSWTRLRIRCKRACSSRDDGSRVLLLLVTVPACEVKETDRAVSKTSHQEPARWSKLQGSALVIDRQIQEGRLARVLETLDEDGIQWGKMLGRFQGPCLRMR